MYPIFWDTSCEMVDILLSKLRANSVQGNGDGLPSMVIDFGEWSRRLALDLIGSAAIGQEFNALKDPTNPLTRAWTLFAFDTTGTSRKYLFAVYSLLPGWVADHWPIWEHRETRNASKHVRETSRKLLDEKASTLETKENDYLDVISAAVRSNAFSTSELIDQTVVLVAAGHGTSMAALSWTILFLCQDPAVQTRLREEIHANLPTRNSDTPITAAAIDSLPYLNAVCNESLRVRPPAPITIKEAVRPTTLLGQYIPKGTGIVVCPQSVNTAPDVWGPDAAAFNPDRWLGERKAQADRNYMLTFLDGPKACIGQGFARSELKCAVAALVGSFIMELEDPDGEVKGIGNIVHRPADLAVRIREAEWL
ncbi:cytochrome P450 [Physcia stellaris]|nr:cytochrome P450 [Physcia stellaris]